MNEWMNRERLNKYLKMATCIVGMEPTINTVLVSISTRWDATSLARSISWWMMDDTGNIDIYRSSRTLKKRRYVCEYYCMYCTKAKYLVGWFVRWFVGWIFEFVFLENNEEKRLALKQQRERNHWVLQVLNGGFRAETQDEFVGLGFDDLLGDVVMGQRRDATEQRNIVLTQLEDGAVFDAPRQQDVAHQRPRLNG